MKVRTSRIRLRVGLGLVLPAFLLCSAAAPMRAHAGEHPVAKNVQELSSWVTVFYRVKPSHTILVRTIAKGTVRNVRAGHYLEAYLPRALFPAGRPVTSAEVEALPPSLLHLRLPDVLNKDDRCTILSNTVSRRTLYLNKDIAKAKPDETPAALSDGTGVFVKTRDISGKARQTEIAQVIEEPYFLPNDPEIILPAPCKTIDSSASQASNLASDVESALWAKKYSESPQVKKALRWAETMVHLRAQYDPALIYKSSGCCAAYVSRTLFYSGLIKTPTLGGKAVDIGRRLKSNGFINILSRDPKGLCHDSTSAPLGAVLVYSGGNDGHTQIKIAPSGKDGYISDFISTRPPPGRRLIGVYIKL